MEKSSAIDNLIDYKLLYENKLVEKTPCTEMQQKELLKTTDSALPSNIVKEIVNDNNGMGVAKFSYYSSSKFTQDELLLLSNACKLKASETKLKDMHFWIKANAVFTVIIPIIGGVLFLFASCLA